MAKKRIKRNDKYSNTYNLGGWMNGVKANKMDRIRNTWAYVKLSMNKENTDRMEFHDMIVHYFV